MLGRLKKEPNYDEEHFGILSDDDLYLDCVLVKPKNVADGELQALRVWVPRYPLTKTSVIACARQEVNAYGADGKIAHLVFDLRGTGDSEGAMADMQFDIDLKSIKAWADERFGPNINLGFLGAPELRNGRVNMLPIRAGVVMETYYYPAANPGRPTIVYLSPYGNFGRLDDARCAALATIGFEVYGLDPMRYLLHASVNGLVTPDDLRQDLETVCSLVEAEPYVIGQPLSAGIAIIWGALVDKVKGVTAIGRASSIFKANHVFDNSQPHTFVLTRYVGRISPRPVALVWHEGNSLGGDKQELAALYQTAGDPKRLERTKEISPQFLYKLLKWQQA